MVLLRQHRKIKLFFLSRFSFTYIHDLQDSRRRGRISLTPLYHFHPLHRHLDISWAITAESSPLNILSYALEGFSITTGHIKSTSIIFSGW